MHRLFPPFLGGTAAIGLLLVRIAAGLALMMHGWPKIQNPTAWMPGGFPPYALAAAAVAEFVGGACLIVGLITPLWAAAAAGTMCVAISFHANKGDPYLSKGGASYELAVAYLAICLLLVLTGPGKLSIDAVLFGKRKATL